MKVEARFFSRLADVAGCETWTAELAGGARVADLLACLYARFPGLEEWDAHIRVAIELEYVERDAALREGDQAAIMPPVQGG